ncbi:MAG TPA: DUF4359 domain-containing protein [Nitrospiraceae bacterium]|nr:DUF4359 domain-containing protein [Nitrospiraceae bacterium]
MNLLQLLCLVIGLSAAVVLALTNPTTEQYLSFVQSELSQAIERMDSSTPERERTVIQNIFRTHGQELIQGVVRPNTVRRNWGLLCRFETKVLDVHIVVLGIGGHFIPLKGVDEAVLRLGRLTF